MVLLITIHWPMPSSSPRDFTLRSHGRIRLDYGKYRGVLDVSTR
jgi:hypothetical protein